MDYAQGYRDGFAAGVATSISMPQTGALVATVEPAGSSQPRKRKVSAYSRAYGRAYKALRRKHTLKSGKLRKGITHKRLVKMAHAEAKKKRRSK